MSDEKTNNILTAVECPSSEKPTIIRGETVRQYAKYLEDESRRAGYADAVAFPRNTAEACAAVRVARDEGWTVTVSGARTGITAGSVPEGGLVLSTERMDRTLGLSRLPDGDIAVNCQAGVVLSDLQKALREYEFEARQSWDAASRDLVDALRRQPRFFPPDPTETSACLGGLVACNASGAHTFRFGPTRPYVEGLTVVLADATVLKIRRGACRADDDGRFVLEKPDGTSSEVHVPNYPQPATKNVAGYASGPGLDAVDLFVGSEGTLGIVTEVELRLIPAPEKHSAAMLFFPAEETALDFTDVVRDEKEALGLEAIEYFGPRALRFLRERRAVLGAASGVPACLPADAACAIYVDIGTSAERMPDVLQNLAAAARGKDADPERCWSACEYSERERLRLFRHALPEAVNSTIAEIRREHPDVTKLGTDMAVPDEYLHEIVRIYRKKLSDAELDYVLFGHIGDNHLHVNILPRNPDEYARGKELYLAFARDVVRMGGSPAAEHGIGKLKKEFLELMIGRRGIAEMRAVKQAFDPECVLGRGTLFR